LTRQEARVYFGLLDLGAVQTGALCNHTGIARSNIYGILHSMIRKGLASYRLKNNIKVFIAAPPETLHTLIDSKRKELQEEIEEMDLLIMELKHKLPPKMTPFDYKYYEGLSGIKTMTAEMMSALNRASTMRSYTARKGSYRKLVSFHDGFHENRRMKKARLRIIYPLDDVALGKRRADDLTEVRFLDLKNDAEWGIIADFVYIKYIIWKYPRGFLIKDRIFAKSFCDVFEKLWQQAELLENME